MRGHGCKLKRRLRAAVEAYLDEPTWARAAQRAGIARSTFCIWMKLPEFRRLADQILQRRCLKIRNQDKAVGRSEPENERHVFGRGDYAQRPAG